MMTLQVNKALKDEKIAMPVNKEGIIKLCQALNMHCSQILAFEGLLYCRGAQGENSPPEDFDMDRLVYFLKYKAKIVAPADNPRVAMQRAPGYNGVRNQHFYPT